jgi:hypothetical protein
MMMNPVSEHHTLHINKELPEIAVIPIAMIGFINTLKSLSYTEIKAEILIPQDIPARNGCLAKVINKKPFIKAEFLKAGDPVPQYPHIGELFDKEVEGVATPSGC